MYTFQTDEKSLSQAQAVRLLVALGFEWMAPEQVKRERLGRYSNMLLESVLSEQLKRLNRINYKGREFHFSEANIQDAVQKLKNVKYDGLLRTNELIYDLLTLGTAMEQNVEGDMKSFTLNYVDWRHPSRNVFHVTAEYTVERARSHKKIRPDLVLFVNGIPFGVMECKAPSVDLEEAVTQMIRNQGDDYCPRLFVYSQLLLAVNKNAAKYATTGTPSTFWSVWKEAELEPGEKEAKQLAKFVNTPLPLATQESLEKTLRLNAVDVNAERLVTQQDKTLYALCRPDRLLALIGRFIVYDGGVKKLARYQQYFVVQSALARVQQKNAQGIRKGGIVWHTQGSGKSLTMVMLARSLALDLNLHSPRIILVTDRDDLDKQLGNTFAACGLETHRASSGKNLRDLVAHCHSGIITTLVNKFDKAFSMDKYCDESSDIFVLVDESHRTQFGSFAARMRQMFPRACYLGFTGTPLLKKEKNNFSKFGGLVDPSYTIRQAVNDGAVVPLLYEGRYVEKMQQQAVVDLWFERHTTDLSDEQKADLKRKYAKAKMLDKAEQVVYMTAFDISEHYRANWQGTGFKAQLVAPSKEVAIRYHEIFKEIGTVSSAVVISPPTSQEGNDALDEGSVSSVESFWQKMIQRYGSEEEYTKQIINQFKNGAEPEILIVVSKLLTGFDAPKNAVLYLCRTLKEHNLLQAIARVNRLCEAKDFGYIVDYVSILGELDQAFSLYGALEHYDDADLDGALLSIHAELSKVATSYSHLWDLFSALKLSKDEEAYELLLGDIAVRDEFYCRLAEFSQHFSVALSSEQFLNKTDSSLLTRYKTDLADFYKLKKSVQLRYAEAIDYRDYEPKIKKLLDTHIQANEVVRLNDAVNIFDEESFNQIKTEQGVSVAAKADRIAHATKKVATEKMDEDPAFYQKFSHLIQVAIDDNRAKRLSDLEYLIRVCDIRDKVVGRVHDDIPAPLQGNHEAIAYFGVLGDFLSEPPIAESIISDAALALQFIVARHIKVDFWCDEDAKNALINDMEDYVYDVLNAVHGVDLSSAQMDELISKMLLVARNHS